MSELSGTCDVDSSGTNPFTGSGHSFLFDLKENSVFFKRSRNPFTGSGHSFDGGWNVFEVKWEVVIPLPVQVILSGMRKFSAGLMSKSS